jgi:hypothetical protein
MMKKLTLFILVYLTANAVVADDSKVWRLVETVYERPNYPIQYSNVGEALEHLQKDHELITNEDTGFKRIKIKNKDLSETWIFFPPNHAAYPVVIKTVNYEGDNGIQFVEYDVLCDKPSKACDQLVVEAKQMMFNHYSMFVE